MEATEEAILNSMCMAGPMTGINGNHCPALPLEEVRRLVDAVRPALGFRRRSPPAPADADREGGDDEVSSGFLPANGKAGLHGMRAHAARGSDATTPVTLTLSPAEQHDRTGRGRRGPRGAERRPGLRVLLEEVSACALSPGPRRLSSGASRRLSRAASPTTLFRPRRRAGCTSGRGRTGDPRAD